MQLANHHAHSHFSDGRLSPREYLQQAIAQGLNAYGFSDHAPIPNSSVGLMSLESLLRYLAEVDTLKEIYAEDIQVYKSLEVDYIPGTITMDSAHIQDANLDYIIGAVHFVDAFSDGTPWGFEGSKDNFERGVAEIFHGDMQAAVGRYYALITEMVQGYQPTIVAHLDRIKKLNKGERFFSEQSSWYREAVENTLVTIKASGSIMEVNTKGYYKNETSEPYPGRWVLAKAKEMGIPVHLASDAHHPEDITKGFEFGASILLKVGYTDVTVLSEGEWIPTPLKPRKLHRSPF
ncbi:MAG: histidinol-phosphatase [Saprospiraceae bacterium]|nr:histidinol-phosphatase [Saprospiraceae bacterium]